MTINGNKPKGKNTMKEKTPKQKKLQVAPPGFEPAPQLPPTQKVKPRTTGPCDHCTICPVKFIVFKHFCLTFTLLELVEEYLS